jgi:hypothetical protein
LTDEPYAPGGSDAEHRHNAYAFVYVLEGAVVMQVKGGKEVTLGPGETFYESQEASACPPGHRPDRPRGHSTDSKWPSDPRPRPTRFDSPSRQPPLACTRPKSQNAPDPGASDR